MDNEQRVEPLTRHNFHYFVSKVEDLCKEAAMENIYFTGVVAYYDPVKQTTGFVSRSAGDKCSLAHILGIVASEIAEAEDSE
jgi:hypothetical protein